MSSGGSKKAIIAALLANLGIAIAKFVGFLITGASALLAESIHSVADTGNQVLLLFGGHRAARVADEEHQFGYGRERYFWSFVVSIVLFMLGGVFAVYEGVEKVRHPHEIESAGWALGILLVAMVLEGLSFRTAVREARPLKGSAGWFRFIRRTKSPELPVVLLEDFGALIGLVLAMAAIGLSIATGNNRWDGFGTLLIGFLLVVIAIVLAIEMKGLLIGEAADPDVQAIIRSTIDGSEPVRRLLHLRTEHLGPDELLVAAKVEFDPDLTMRRLADAIDEVEANVRTAVPEARRLFIEPDVHRPQGTEP